MADKKISELTAATEPLTGSEIVPVVQSGETVRTSAQAVADLAPIASLDPASTPLAGTESVAIDQGGDKVRATVQDVADLFPISTLSAASTPLAGTELVPVSQGGNKRRATTQDVADLYPIATLSAASTPLAGTEIIPLVQSGNKRRATAQDVADLYPIATLTAATTPLTGTEIIPLVQSGNKRRATAQDVADLAAGSGGYFTLTATDRIVGSNAGAGSSGNRVFLAGENAGANSTVSDLIVIGNNALDSSVTDADAVGSIAIGSSAAGALTTLQADPIYAIGRNALTLATHADGIYIGDAVASSTVGGSVNQVLNNTVIGHEAAQNVLLTNAPTGQFIDSVLIGKRVCRPTAAGQFVINKCVVIGTEAVANTTGGGSAQINSSVVIGYQAGHTAGAAAACTQNVLIGTQAGDSLTGGDGNVIIGHSADCGTNTTQCVIIGSNSVVTGDFNVLVGDNIIRTTGTRNVMIGSSAGNGEAGANNDRFIVETFVATVRRAILYADMNAGNLIVGSSVPSGGGANRDFGGVGATNILKLLNGTKGGTNPVGGGYFYISAGALHWVGSGGTDTTVAPA